MNRPTDSAVRTTRRTNRMNRALALLVLPLFGAQSLADDVSRSDRLLCSASSAQMCFETGECFSAAPWELDVPQFILIDTKKETLSTTAASSEQRSSPISHIHRTEGTLVVQGFEGGRAFSIVVEESLGALTAAIARGGVSVSVFGACTDSRKL